MLQTNQRDAFVMRGLFLPARRHASAGNSDRNVSVRPRYAAPSVLELGDGWSA